jgi:exodeoxyribonuclease VII small subunit
MMAQKNFESSIKRLEEIVHDLEKGDLALEESLKAFEEGMNLIKFCSEKLEEVEQKVTMLVKAGNDKYVHQPFDIEKNEED